MHNLHNGFQHGFSNLVGGHFHLCRQAVALVSAAQLVFFNVLQRERAAHGALCRLCRLLADNQVKLSARVFDNILVEHRAAHGNAAAYGKAIHRKHADVAHTLAERDNHAAVRTGNIQPRTDRRRHRRFDQAHLANAVRCHSVHHRTALHFRNTARYRHNGARHENAAVRHLFQVMLQRRVHQRQIGNHTARHGLDHAHAIARSAKHFIRAAAHGHHTVRVFIYGDDVRFIHHNTLAVYI